MILAHESNNGERDATVPECVLRWDIKDTGQWVIIS